MKIALFGARGTIGQRIAAEARARGHVVTGFGRETDVTDASVVAKAVAGQDAVIGAVGAGFAPDARPWSMLSDAARGLLAGLEAAGVKRLLVVGGAGSLEVAPGAQLVDQPSFPEAWKGAALAHRDALDVYRTARPSGVEWTYLSPAALIEPGERTGKYRIGGEGLLVGARGESRISTEDFAVALVDELERGAHVRARIGVAY
jgi:putative NADH-flavin reductase